MNKHFIHTRGDLLRIEYILNVQTMPVTTVSFHWVDYLVFSASLAIGLVVGVVFVFTGRKQKTSKEYLLGGGDMNAVMVGTSLLLSVLNAVFLLGGTAEVYYR